VAAAACASGTGREREIGGSDALVSVGGVGVGGAEGRRSRNG
jgi:hypothetical protein